MRKFPSTHPPQPLFRIALVYPTANGQQRSKVVTEPSIERRLGPAYRRRGQLPPNLQRMSSSLPVSRLVAGWYGGGLWLWLCAMAQGGLEPPHQAYPWILLLLALALLLGLLEGMRWESLGVPRDHGAELDVHGVLPVRFVAAVFIYLLPCAALLLTERFGNGLLAAAVAVPSCLLGRMLEQHAYETALASDLRGFG